MYSALKMMLVMLAGLLVTSVVIADESEDVLDKYSFCMVCHGYQAQGNTSVAAPPLAGIEPWYLVAALDAYRAGQRHTSATALEMQAAARMIPASADTEAYKFIAQMTVAPDMNATATQAQIQRGAEAYSQFCVACHGENAQGNELLKAPGLSRLSGWYLQSAWQAYVSGNRGDENAPVSAQQMRQFSVSLPAQISIEDITAYLQNIK